MMLKIEQLSLPVVLVGFLGFGVVIAATVWSFREFGVVVSAIVFVVSTVLVIGASNIVLLFCAVLSAPRRNSDENTHDNGS